jgi:hypothetical protein
MSQTIVPVIKTALFIIYLSLPPLSAFAQEWEYKVVFLPSFMDVGSTLLSSPSVKKGAITEEASGAHIDTTKTEILNRLAQEGWEVIGVTGLSGADHAVYLRRKRAGR